MNDKKIVILLFLASGVMLLDAFRRQAGQETGQDSWTPEQDDNPIWFPNLGDFTDTVDYWVQAQAQSAHTLSPVGLEKIKAFEGFSATAYPDHKGYSIGYGHLIKVGDGLSRASRVSPEQALQLLAGDIGWAVAAVNQAVHVGLAQQQFDALVSLCFNIGESAYKSSTLVKRINSGDTGAAAEFDRWVHSSGQVNSTLVARRAQERADFESAA